MNLEQLAQSNIIDTLKLADAPKDAQQEALDEAKDIILQIVAERIEDDLPDEAQEEFESVFGADGTQEERNMFLKKYVPNFEQIVQEETLRYKVLAEVVGSLGE